MSNSLRPHELSRLFCPWNFAGKILEWVAIFSPPGDIFYPGIIIATYNHNCLNHQNKEHNFKSFLKTLRMATLEIVLEYKNIIIIS